MKRVIFMLVVLFLVGTFFVSRNAQMPTNVSQQPKVVNKELATPASSTPSTSLFVPYWSLNSSVEQKYDYLIYFGVEPTLSGINTEEEGYAQLERFTAIVSEEQPTLLTLRMLDSTENFAILKDTAKQNEIIKETLAIAKENGFDGVVLDLELSALPFDSLMQQINRFVDSFSKQAKQEDFYFAITAYGDTFYRIRPFEIKTLATYVDSIMIMAYDLHKAGGNPGPNFPLGGQETYGYDYKKLVDHFLNVVPPEKLNVVFGLFGYDWQVDDKNIAQAIGEGKSTNEITQHIVNNCDSLKCSINRDVASQETVIKYIDAEGKRHTVWYEDLESVQAKQVYLKSRGLANFSFWAHSYF